VVVQAGLAGGPEFLESGEQAIVIAARASGGELAIVTERANAKLAR
jgi:hypothetical protein